MRYCARNLLARMAEWEYFARICAVERSGPEMEMPGLARLALDPEAGMPSSMRFPANNRKFDTLRLRVLTNCVCGIKMVGSTALP